MAQSLCNFSLPLCLVFFFSLVLCVARCWLLISSHLLLPHSDLQLPFVVVRCTLGSLSASSLKNAPPPLLFTLPYYIAIIIAITYYTAISSERPYVESGLSHRDIPLLCGMPFCSIKFGDLPIAILAFCNQWTEVTMFGLKRCALCWHIRLCCRRRPVNNNVAPP